MTIPASPDSEEDLGDENHSSKKGPRKGALVFSVAIVVGFFVLMSFAVLYQPKPKPEVNLAAMPALETSVGQTASPSAPEKNKNPLSGVRSIEISNLNAVIEGEAGGQSAKISFKLINHGDPTTPYPDLRLKWRGSTAKDSIVASDQYAHPVGPFINALPVVIELHKPAHAVGIDIQLNDKN